MLMEPRFIRNDGVGGSNPSCGTTDLAPCNREAHEGLLGAAPEGFGGRSYTAVTGTAASHQSRLAYPGVRTGSDRDAASKGFEGS
jgi:hypothetical protein